MAIEPTSTTQTASDFLNAVERACRRVYCPNGSEKVFAELSESEIEAALKASALHYLFLANADSPDFVMIQAFGFVQHLFYAKFAREADVLSAEHLM